MSNPFVFLTAALFSIISSSSLLPLAPVELREINSPYPLIDPLLVVETDQRLYTEYDSIDNQINSFIDQAKKNHQAEAVSVYFRNEQSGHWTGVNQDEKYEPSSMLKVAVMIAYFRAALNISSVSSSSIQAELNKNIYYPGYDEEGQYYTAITHFTPGYYTALDLINYMILNSDNVAAAILIDNNPYEFQQVYNDFRLPAAPEEASDYMTARSYSVLFRTLYNSTYIPRRWSQEALSILTKTNFNKGLMAGVPASTTAAHKFGEHTYVYADGTVQSHQLHDCGIIYYPSDPYLLCVMTKGNDFPNLEKTISGVSKLVYNWVDTTNKNAVKNSK